MGRIVDARMFTDKEKFFRIVIEDGQPLDYKPGQFMEVSVFGIGEAPDLDLLRPGRRTTWRCASATSAT